VVRGKHSRRSLAETAETTGDVNPDFENEGTSKGIGGKKQVKEQKGRPWKKVLSRSYKSATTV